ncbi:MAG: translation initiation factor IF-2 [Alphaproteobacteria bacterium]
MAEEKKKETLTLGTLSLGSSGDSGKRKGVAVEVKKKRTFKKGADGQLHSEGDAPKTQVIDAEEPMSAEAESKLTTAERERRAKVLEAAQIEEEKRKAEEKKRKAAEAKRKKEAEAVAEKERQAQLEAEKAEAEKSDEERQKEKEAQEKEAARKRLEEEREAAERARKEMQEARLKAEAVAAKTEAGHVRRDDRGKAKKKNRREDTEDTSRANRGDKKTRGGFDEGERSRSLAAMRRAREKQKKKFSDQPKEKQKLYREVTIPETLTVGDLANRMSERAADVIKELMKLGIMATINQTIDADTAELVAEEMGHKVVRVSESDVEEALIIEDESDDENLEPRAPIVTIMGHVDHGKTSLLDALRSANVADKEAGGITQHIGAYQVSTDDGKKITFIDTPGHAAFTEMRARGAKITDIVVLIVAANDSVMPQTIEAINHAQAAGVPIIVAINKIDLPAANPQKVKTDLLQHNVALEDFGGDVLSVEISAKARIGLEELLDTIMLQSEVLDLKANPNRPGRGAIVESRMEKGRGSVATALIQSGTLNVGDIFVAGAEWGRVRALLDDHGDQVKSAGPAVPVEVLGLQGTPAAGDEIIVVADEAKAREISEYRQRKEREAKAAAAAKSGLEALMEHMAQNEDMVTLPVVIKADVHGSVEAIVGALEKLQTEDARVQVLHSGVGAISEADITLANASSALIIGFNVRANPQARETAKRDNVDIRYYSIIYEVIDDMKRILSGMLSPEIKEHFIGYARIDEVFNITKVGKVAGCMVTEGIVKRGAKVRLLRDNVVIHEGELSQLKRFKDDAKEVREGMECGMSFANYDDLKVGDMIECFEIEEIAREI